MSRPSRARGRAALVAVLLLCCAALAVAVWWQQSDGGGTAGSIEADALLAPEVEGAGSLSIADRARDRAADVTPERASIANPAELAPSPAADVPARAFAGILLDADRGFPIAGATVELEPRNGVRAELLGGAELTVTSDSDGRFAGTWPQAKDPNLLVRAEGYRELRLPRVRFDDELVLRLERGANLSVFVDDRGAATGDIEIVVHEMRIGGDRLSEAATATVAPGDSADFADLTPGEFFVAAGAPGTGFALERIELAPGEQRHLSLALPRGTGLAGRIVDRESDAPIEGVEVWVRPSAQGVWSRLERRFEERTVTGEDGRYAFEALHPGEVVVHARAPWGSETRRRVTLDPSRSVTEQDLRLASPGSVSGTVRDASGKPVDQAVVIVWVGRVRGTIGELQVRESSHRASTLTDGAGRFRFEGLPADESLHIVAEPLQDISASAPVKTDRSDVVRVELSSGEARDGVEIRLMPTATAVGHVVNEDGRPVEGARVSLQRLGVRTGGTWSAARTNADGRFEVGGLVEGRYRVRANHDDYVTGREEFEFAGLEPPAIEVVLARASSVEVAVVDERGATVVALDVQLMAKDDSGRGRLVPSERPNEFGTTRFAGLSPGRYTVLASARDFEPAKDGDFEFDLGVAEERYVEVVLRDRPRAEGAAVVGTVEMTTGELARRVRFADRRGGSLTVEDGRFRLTGARPGRTRLVLQADDSMPHVTEPVLLVPGGELDLGAIELEPAARVEVFVVDPDGRRVRDAKVRLMPLPEAEGGRGAGEKAISPSGRRGQEGFFPRVPLHAWTVRVQHPDFFRRDERLVVDESRERFTITVQPR